MIYFFIVSFCVFLLCFDLGLDNQGGRFKRGLLEAVLDLELAVMSAVICAI